MRVNDSNLNAVTIGTRQAGRTDDVQTGRSGASSARGYANQDRVSLSDLSSMVAKAAESPDRSERINQLAAAYRSGNYRADAAAVSSSIVNDAMKAG